MSIEATENDYAEAAPVIEDKTLLSGTFFLKFLSTNVTLWQIFRQNVFIKMCPTCISGSVSVEGGVVM